MKVFNEIDSEMHEKGGYQSGLLVTRIDLHWSSGT